MLRASAQTAGTPVDLRSVTDRAIHSNISAGTQLLDFVDALIHNDFANGSGAIETTRQALIEAAGIDGAARATLVIANFEMMNRILDATGVPVPTRMGEITTELGLPAYTQRH